MEMKSLFLAGFIVFTYFSGATSTSYDEALEQVKIQSPLNVTADSLQNIHVEYSKSDFAGELHFVYGDCDLAERSQSHHSIGCTEIKRTAQSKRFVWIVPEDVVSGGCVHAFSGLDIIGRSSSVAIKSSLKKRQLLSEVADISGPWFDGVAYMKSINHTDAFVTAAKNKSIAIVGGGMAGLLTSLILQSVGIKNWEIMESSQRVGGRIRTKYLNGTKPSDYQYQEMGPMRFPVSVTYADTNETLQIKDHQMVFQLADVLNQMNEHDPSLKINFIPWIQNSPNAPADSRGVRLPDGTIPSAAEIAANASLIGAAQISSNATEEIAAFNAVNNLLGFDREKFRAFANNVYKVHKQAIEDGILDWSLASYLHYAIGISWNVTDFLAGAGVQDLWYSLYEGVYFSATTWRTIDKGLESMPLAFMPHIKKKTRFGRHVSGLTYDKANDKIAVNWRDEDDKYNLAPKSKSFDYAYVSVPFTRVRLWRMPPLSSLLSRAINTLNYDTACKVALHYKTRFWEHTDPPIIGGCGTVDIPGVGIICYPSYAINSSLPGVILASYTTGLQAAALGAFTESEHVALVQRAMIEAHGPIAAEQWTGNYERQCWALDEHQGAGWASPLAGQQELYLPAYFRTEFKTIFIGEHTSYTHSWIFSALDSAVRGSVQLLLDMGLVDEAKEVVNKWMGRWISL